MTGKTVSASDLSDKQRIFADTFLLTGEKRASAVKAGYPFAAAHVAASRMLKNDKVLAYLAARRGQVIAKAEKEFDVSIERILRELCAIAFLDPRKLFTESGGVRPISELDDDAAKAIAGLDVLEQYTSEGDFEGYVKKLRFNSKISALELLGKYKNMWGDKGNNENNILNITIVTDSNQLEQPDAPKVIEHAPIF